MNNNNCKKNIYLLYHCSFESINLAGPYILLNIKSLLVSLMMPLNSLLEDKRKLMLKGCYASMPRNILLLRIKGCLCLKGDKNSGENVKSFLS